MGNCFESNMLRFVKVLRASGLQISPSEIMDALLALQNIEMGDRTQFQSALKATLTKDIADEHVFSSAFDAFFTESAMRQEQIDQRQQYIESQEQMKKDLEFQNQGLNLNQEDMELYARLPEKTKKQVQQFVKKSSEGKNVSANFKPIIENLIKGALEYQRSQMGQSNLIPVEFTGEEELDGVLHQVARSSKDNNLLYQDMAKINEEDYSETLALIRKLSRHLATRISRRYKQSSKIKKLDIRRSIRSGIKYGGVLLDLKYKQKRVQKPEILMLCDVSGSMLRYSQFTLQFMNGLAEVLPRMHAFIFADDLEKVDFTKFSAGSITESKKWGEGTNLNISLKELRENYSSLIKKSTILIILSDTKTEQAELAVNQLKSLKSITKEIIWLNPMSGAQWARYSTVALFKNHTNMWECSSLAHLSKALSKQLG